MSEIPPIKEEVEIVEEASNPDPNHRKDGEKSSALLLRAEKIREELGILGGQVTLTFLDDETY